MTPGLSMLEVVDQLGQERHADPALYEMLVRRPAALARARPGPRPGGPGLLPEGRSRSTARRRCSTRALVRARRDGRAGGVRQRRGRGAVPRVPARAAALGRRRSRCCAGSWGAASAAVLAGPRPAGADEVAALATEAMEAHLEPAPARPCAPPRWLVRCTAGPTPFGVYVHVPFCRHRCDYCAFATYTDRDHLMARYVDACVPRSKRAPRRRRLPPATSVFFGGGTPSRLERPTLSAGCSPPCAARPGAEVTVECNPEDAARAPGRLPAAGRDPAVASGSSRPCPTCSARSGVRHGPARAPRRVAAAAEAGFDHLERRPDLRRGRERDRRGLGADLGRRPVPRAARRRT